MSSSNRMAASIVFTVRHCRWPAWENFTSPGPRTSSQRRTGNGRPISRRSVVPFLVRLINERSSERRSRLADNQLAERSKSIPLAGSIEPNSEISILDARLSSWQAGFFYALYNKEKQMPSTNNSAATTV